MEQESVTQSSQGSPRKSGSSMPRQAIIIFVVLVAVGIGIGYLFASKKSNSVTTVGSDGTVSETSIKKGDIIGSEDEKTFKDSAEGELKEGGIEGEGQFHLERPGGDSQNVYLTSSVLDLSPFVGRKVKIWGQTFTAEKAGWLMDVGRLQVVE